MVYRLDGEHLEYGRLDGATESVQTIDYAHHEIHAGSHFFYTDSAVLASAGSQSYLITTPDTTSWAHMKIQLDGSAITQFLVYEDCAKSGSVAGTVFNSNRNSSETTGLLVYKGTSGSLSDGNLIFQYKGGAATAQSKSGAGSRSDEEIILKQNSSYLVKIVSGTNDNLTNINLSWYEHTSRH